MLCGYVLCICMSVIYFIYVSISGFVSVCLCGYVSVLCVCLCICLTVCLCICLSVWLCICLSVCPCICLSVCLCICLYVWLCRYLSVCVAVYLFVCGAVYLSELTIVYMVSSWGPTHPAFLNRGRLSYTSNTFWRGTSKVYSYCIWIKKIFWGLIYNVCGNILEKNQQTNNRKRVGFRGVIYIKLRAVKDPLNRTQLCLDPADSQCSKCFDSTVLRSLLSLTLWCHLSMYFSVWLSLKLKPYSKILHKKSGSLRINTK